MAIFFSELNLANSQIKKSEELSQKFLFLAGILAQKLCEVSSSLNMNFHPNGGHLPKMQNLTLS